VGLWFIAVGLLALAFYAVHCAWHVRQGHAEDGLWACHVAAALIGVGLLGGWATPVAIGVTWLMPAGLERHDLGVPRPVPETMIDVPDAFIVLDLTLDSPVEAFFPSSFERVCFSGKSGETLCTSSCGCCANT